MSNLSEPVPASSQKAEVSSGDRALVSIEFVRDIAFGDNAIDYRRGTRWLADPATAAGLILIGAAARVLMESAERPAS
jgi:hypothetical protein